MIVVEVPEALYVELLGRYWIGMAWSKVTVVAPLFTPVPVTAGKKAVHDWLFKVANVKLMATTADPFRS